MTSRVDVNGEKKDFYNYKVLKLSKAKVNGSVNKY